MTARAEYTDGEWTLLQMTPYAVGLAVSFADGAGILETFSEVAALANQRARGAEHYPGNELVAALLSDRETPPAPQVEQAVTEDGKTDIADTLRVRALDDCRAVIALLEDRSHPAEAEGYRRFLIDVALATARAARHGGWLRQGPVIDERERAVLCEFATVLGVEIGDEPDLAPCGDSADAAGPRVTPPAVADGGGPGFPTGAIHPE